MYNDYYLQEINNKLATTNNNLDDILENQELINQQLILIESGDKEIKEELVKANQGLMAINLILMLTLIYTFIVRCLR